MRDLCVTSDTPTPSHPANVGVRVPPWDYKHNDLLPLPTCAVIKRRCICTRCRRLTEVPVLQWRIMIDWLELDLHQTLKCAAGNYFVLERQREGGGGRDI